MHFNIFIYPTLPATMEERLTQRPIGRSTSHYQAMLEQVRELTVFAEDLGYDSISLTEHHFHSEGWEMSVNPLLLMTDLASRTERIKFLTLGLTTGAWDPIRLAEDTAIVDQLTKGRMLYGFARGYQARAMAVLGQRWGTAHAPSDGSAGDLANREVHEEILEIVHKAWTQDLVTHHSENYNIPPVGGFPAWPPTGITGPQGSPGELDEDGNLTGVTVVPRPYQVPHPKLYQGFSMSPSTMEYTAKRGIQPLVLIPHPELFRGLVETYHRIANDNGYAYGLGQNIGAMRSVQIGTTRDEADRLLTEGHYPIWKTWFGAFGFWEALRTPADQARWPLGEQRLPQSEWTTQRMRETKYALTGTRDDVRRDFEELLGCHGAGGELETFTWLFDQGAMSLDDCKRQLERFAEAVVDEYGDTSRAKAVAGAG